MRAKRDFLLSETGIKHCFTEMDMEYKAALMSSEDILRALKRISHQIIEKNRGLDKVCLVGIKRA